MSVYTVEEVAEILKMRKETIRFFCREGKIESIKIGRSYRIPEKAIKNLIG